MPQIWDTICVAFCQLCLKRCSIELLKFTTGWDKNKSKVWIGSIEFLKHKQLEFHLNAKLRAQMLNLIQALDQRASESAKWELEWTIDWNYLIHSQTSAFLCRKEYPSIVNWKHCVGRGEIQTDKCNNIRFMAALIFKKTTFYWICILKFF